QACLVAIVNQFEKRIAIVIGGASGIGRALCEELARRGADVVVADINFAGAQSVATAIGARAACVGVRDAAALQALVDDVVTRHGRLDLIFNNAGIGVAGGFHELTLDHWRTVIQINLMGVVHGVAAAYPLMVRQGSGQIVNVASLAGL